MESGTVSVTRVLLSSHPRFGLDELPDRTVNLSLPTHRCRGSTPTRKESFSRYMYSVQEHDEPCFPLKTLLSHAFFLCPLHTLNTTKKKMLRKSELNDKMIKPITNTKCGDGQKLSETIQGYLAKCPWGVKQKPTTITQSRNATCKLFLHLTTLVQIRPALGGRPGLASIQSRTSSSRTVLHQANRAASNCLQATSLVF